MFTPPRILLLKKRQTTCSSLCCNSGLYKLVSENVRESVLSQGKQGHCSVVDYKDGQIETDFLVLSFHTHTPAPQHLVETVPDDYNYHQLRPKSLLVSFSVFLIYTVRFQNQE